MMMIMITRKNVPQLLAVSDRQCMSKDLSKWFSFFFCKLKKELGWTRRLIK